MQSIRIIWGLLAFLVCAPVFALPATGVPLSTCLRALQGPGAGKLLGIVVGGRATGKNLTHAAHRLGFETVHIYATHISPEITNSFDNRTYDYPAIRYEHDGQLSAVLENVVSIAETKKLELAGFVAGMDYGVYASDVLNYSYGHGNSPALWRSDKALLNDHLKLRGVPVVETFTMHPDELLAKAELLTYPLFIKPTCAWGSVGASSCRGPEQIPSVVHKFRTQAERLNIPSGNVVVQSYLHPDKVYFVDTISYVTDKPRRLVTGVWVDERGEDFPKEVWDLIYLLPPPALLPPKERQIFHWLLQANEMSLFHSGVQVGSTHLEFMAPTKEITSSADFKPTDLNLRLPGLDCPGLERHATGTDPYTLDILSHTLPEKITGVPELYSNWKEHVALIFVRAFQNGKVTSEGLEWLEALRTPSERFDGAYLLDFSLPKAESAVKTTIDGSTMVGFLHVAGPSIEAIKKLHAALREKERQGFFSK